MKPDPRFVYADDAAALLGISPKRMRDLWNDEKAPKDPTPGVRLQCRKDIFYQWMPTYIQSKKDEVTEIHKHIRKVRAKRKEFAKENGF